MIKNKYPPLDPDVKICLRDRYLKLNEWEDESQVLSTYKRIIDIGLTIIAKHLNVNNLIDVDANLLFQMTIVKSISILQLAAPIQYHNDVADINLIEHRDPFGTLNIIRSQFEAYCNFNNIFVQSSSRNERQLKYNLWVLSGLLYRQRFLVTTASSQKKLIDEANQIERIKTEIHSNKCYAMLDEKSKQIIDTLIKRKDWKFSINGQKANKLSWHEMMNNSGVSDIIDDQYTYLSLCTHPSNVSVFQYDAMYENSDQKRIVIFCLKLSTLYISFFIRDYISYFNLEGPVFSDLEVFDQMIINAYNHLFRGAEFAVNNINELLN